MYSISTTGSILDVEEILKQDYEQTLEVTVKDTSREPTSPQERFLPTLEPNDFMINPPVKKPTPSPVNKVNLSWGRTPVVPKTTKTNPTSSNKDKLVDVREAYFVDSKEEDTENDVWKNTFNKGGKP